MELDIAKVLVALAKDLWDATLSGGGTPAAMERYKRMRNPQFGDLVYVWLTKRGTPPEQLIGRYDSCWSYLGEWDEEDGEWWPREEVYGIELLDGTYCKWTNVELLALPYEVTDGVNTGTVRSSTG